MWSAQRFCWTMTKRLWDGGARRGGVCVLSHLPACLSAAQHPSATFASILPFFKTFAETPSLNHRRSILKSSSLKIFSTKPHIVGQISISQGLAAAMWAVLSSTSSLKQPHTINSAKKNSRDPQKTPDLAFCLLPPAKKTLGF